MLGMDGQNRYHCATNLMNYTASEMYRILCKLTVYDGVAILYLIENVLFDDGFVGVLKDFLLLNGVVSLLLV